MKTLPIQIVKTRGNQDIYKKEAGGNQKIPDWVNDNSVRDNALRMLSTINDLSIEFDERARRNNTLPILMVTSLNKNATAKSYRSSTRSIFDGRKKRNVIGVEGKNRLLITRWRNYKVGKI